MEGPSWETTKKKQRHQLCDHQGNSGVAVLGVVGVVEGGEGGHVEGVQGVHLLHSGALHLHAGWREGNIGIFNTTWSQGSLNSIARLAMLLDNLLSVGQFGLIA